MVTVDAFMQSGNSCIVSRDLALRDNACSAYRVHTKREIVVSKETIRAPCYLASRHGKPRDFQA